MVVMRAQPATSATFVRPPVKGCAMASDPASVTASQLSPGREWWWTGSEWVPAASHPDGQAALAAPVVPPQAPAPVVPVAPVAVVEPVFEEPWRIPQPPFDWLGLIALLLCFLPLLGLNQIAAYFLAKRAYRKRIVAGFRRSGLALAARIISTAAFWLTLVFLLLWLAGYHPFRTSHASVPSGPASVPAAPYETAQQAVAVESAYHAKYGIYAPEAGLVAHGYAPAPGITSKVLHADRTRFCLQLSSAEGTYWYDSTTSVLSGERCS
jgi:hypothetical protein